MPRPPGWPGPAAPRPALQTPQHCWVLRDITRGASAVGGCDPKARRRLSSAGPGAVPGVLWPWGLQAHCRVGSRGRGGGDRNSSSCDSATLQRKEEDWGAGSSCPPADALYQGWSPSYIGGCPTEQGVRAGHVPERVQKPCLAWGCLSEKPGPALLSSQMRAVGAWWGHRSRSRAAQHGHPPQGLVSLYRRRRPCSAPMAAPGTWRHC